MIYIFAIPNKISLQNQLFNLIMNTETLLGAVSDLALAFLSDCRGLVVLNGISFLNPGFYPLIDIVLNPCDCTTVKCTGV
tara:strand:+ start:265 stop:504 length:240 start_codon:yes stop_codon:yes gene_type:complete